MWFWLLCAMHRTINELYHQLKLPKDSFQGILRDVAENVIFEGKPKWQLKIEYR